MRIIVLGAGAIGSVYGAKLAAVADVTLVGRADHVNAINADGLRIEGIDTRTVRVRAATQIDRIDPDALVILTTKVPATATALAPIADLVRADTMILSLQNGLGSEEIARAALHGRGTVLRGVTHCGAIFEQPGLVKYMAAGSTVIEQHERSQQISEVFNAAGLRCRTSDNIAVEVWQKLVFNCVVNPITTILGSEVGGIADPRLDRLKQLVVEECVAVAAAERITLAPDLVQQINRVFAPSRNIVSMQQDLLRGRTTEIDYMNGAVAAVGGRHGIDCPVNAALTTIVKAMEAQARSLVPKEMLEPQPA
jgi:2-dehydropantoate 2-reductase